MADVMAHRWGVSMPVAEAAVVPGSGKTDHSQAPLGGALAHIRAVAGLQRASANVAQFQQTSRRGVAQLVKKRCAMKAGPFVCPELDGKTAAVTPVHARLSGVMSEAAFARTGCGLLQSCVPTASKSLCS